MKIIIPKLLAISALSLSISLIMNIGCASRKDIYNLEQRNRHTMQEALELFQQLENKIILAREEARKNSAPMQAKQANIWAEVESLKTDVASIKGQLDTLTMRMGAQNNQEVTQLNERLKAIELILETQLAMDLSKSVNVAENTIYHASTTSTGPTGNIAVALEDPAKVLYAKGLTAFKARRYYEAQRDFAEFTKTFKNHVLVSNAIFWHGECHYQMGDYAKAVLSYQDIIDKYKDSPKYHSAMLKQGISFHRLGKGKSGKIILNELINKNPKVIESTRAKQFLTDPNKY